MRGGDCLPQHRSGNGLCRLPPPTITSITSNIWYAGQSASVAVRGTGFITTANASLACPVTTVTVTTPDNSAVTVSNVNVNNPTLLVATIEPVSTAPTEAATLTVNGAAAPSPNADILGAPIISLNGKPISGPGAITPNPTPVVGQSLALTTTPTVATLAALPIPLSVESSTWTVTGGTNIGGYTPATSSASVMPMPPLNELGLSFYSVYPAASVAETYTLCTHPPPGVGALACNPVATATFGVAGVSSPAINIGNELLANIDDLTGCAAASGGPTLVYGNLQGPAAACGVATGTPGLTFYPFGTPPGAGNFLFAQIVNSDSVIDSRVGATTTCTGVSGVDGQYTYQGQINPLSTSDSPETPLPSTYTTVTRNFTATMYLLWQSTTKTDSIPVPLGYIPWAFNGTATNEGTAANPAWTASGTGAPVMSDGEVSTEGLIGSFEALPDAGSPNSAFVPATTISDIPVWNGLEVPASASCVTTTN